MKHLLLPLVLIALFAVVGFRRPTSVSSPAVQRQEPSITSSVKVYTVIELFTSEGCSSCPAADKLLADLAADSRFNLIVLGFHVDYWNRLGWKDRFSDASFSERQRKYAATIPGGEVYTPQAIVNGTQQLVGSDEPKLRALIKTSIVPEGQIKIKPTQSNSSGPINIDYSCAISPMQVLNIALVQSDAVTAVKSGENRGLELHHINIVRNFVSLKQASGNISMNLPKNTTGKELKVVAYVQERSNGRVFSTTGLIPVE